MMDERNLNIELIARCLQNTATEAEKQELLLWIHQRKENENAYFDLKDLYEAGNWKRLKMEANTPQHWEALQSKLRSGSVQPAGNGRVIRLLKYAAVLILGALLL